MITYGLILGVVGTLVCITAEPLSLLPYEPVCGTDDETYSHLTLLNAQKSEDPNLELAHPGKCKHERHVRSVSSPCPKEVKEVCGTDGVTYANFCLLDQVHIRNDNITLSHLGLCNNKTVEEQTNVASGVINATENVFNATTEAVEDFRDVQNSKNTIKAQNLIKTSNVENLKKINESNDDAEVMEDSEDAITLEDTRNVQQTEQETEYKNITIVETLEDEQAQNLKMPIVEKNATIEIEAKKLSTSSNTSDATEIENNQKKNNEKSKTNSDGQNVNENHGKSKDVNTTEKSRKRRDVKNLAEGNGNYKVHAELDGKIKVSKNKNGKSTKQRNLDNVSYTKTGEEQTNTEDKVERTPKDAQDKSEKSRKRRDVHNLGKMNNYNEQNQGETQHKINSKNGKNKFAKSEKQQNLKATGKPNYKDVRNEKEEGINKPHQSRKQRDVNEKYGKNKHFQKSKHIKRTDSKTKKGGQKPNRVS